MQFRLALITGASSGIGEALCYLIADQGIPLIATGRSMERLQALQLALSAKVAVEIVVGDLAVKADRVKLIDIIHQKKPDLLINNAGFGLYGDALTYDTDQQLGMMEVNSCAVLELTLEAARTLINEKIRGVIMNISSAAAFQIYPGLAVYAASKACVNHFSESLDLEMQPYGIRVLAACPGMVDTPFSTRAGKVNQQVTNGLVMAPNEVAKLIWDQIQNPIAIKIINWKYRFLTALSCLLPKSILTKRLKDEILERIELKAYRK